MAYIRISAYTDKLSELLFGFGSADAGGGLADEAKAGEPA